MTGLDAIKSYEGLRLKAYDDGTGVQTIGWGHTAGVRPGDTITQEQAEAYLAADVAECEDVIGECVNVPLTDGQRWALVSFIFNVGAGAFKGSTLLRLLNAGNYQAAADQFTRWNQASGHVMPGLATRRAAERVMFLGETPETAPQPQPDALPPVITLTPKPVPTKGTAMPVFLIPLLSAILQAVPALAAKWGGDASVVATRNTAIATTVAQAAISTLGAVNEQQAIEKLQSDPTAIAKVQQVVQDMWFQIDSTGIGAAREADLKFVQGGYKVWKSPSFWFTVMMLPVIYAIVGAIIGVWGHLTLSEVLTGNLLTGIVTAVLFGSCGFYYGAMTSANKAPAPQQ